MMKKTMIKYIGKTSENLIHGMIYKADKESEEYFIIKIGETYIMKDKKVFLKL